VTCRIIQFGTSRFLQAHVDLFVAQAAAEGQDAGPIAVVQTTGSPESRRRIAGFRTVRPYPVLIRGRAEGRVVDRREAVDSVHAAFHADTEWADVTHVFVRDASFVVCNVGEAGYALDPSDGPATQVPRSFPAKLLALLRARHAGGAGPITVLPCELTRRNGDTLKRIVLDLAREWSVAAPVIDWIARDCLWANTLVDRIVAEALEPVGAIAEPYALWAIEAQPGLAAPCRHPDIRLVEDLLPYERLKLFILNLGHTWLAERWLREQRPAAETVGEALADPALRSALLAVYETEVLAGFAAVGMAEPARAYLATVLDRFDNPFLRHRLADIAVNHAAKKRQRIGGLLDMSPCVPMPALRACLGAAG
jgi:tagaturonate reductase